jgi:hypothetical protein
MSATGCWHRRTRVKKLEGAGYQLTAATILAMIPDPTTIPSCQRSDDPTECLRRG